MSLKDKFNNRYTARKDNEFVLSLYYSAQGGSTYISFDFLTRTMVTRNSYGDAGLVVTPFAQLDRDMLIDMRDTLVDMGGTPPELGPDPSAAPAQPRKLNL